MCSHRDSRLPCAHASNIFDQGVPVAEQVSCPLSSVLAAPVPPDRTGCDQQRADLEKRRLDNYCRLKQEARKQFIGREFPQWMRDEPSCAVADAPVATERLSTMPHTCTVTVLPDREGKWKGKVTNCTVLCKWKAIAIRAADRKMGSKTVRKVTLAASGPAHVVSHSTLLYVVYVWFYPIASTRT